MELEIQPGKKVLNPVGLGKRKRMKMLGRGSEPDEKEGGQLA
jgi:hypothetical protein